MPMTGDENRILLYHTGFYVLENPDIHFGKKNADFGQGFYLSDNEEFSHRWAKSRANQKTYINTYELTLSGLKVKVFDRDEQWFRYIFDNRSGKPDSLQDYDVIIGPIANDTIYDVMGITTSGYLTDADSLQLLKLGPAYHQITIKSPLAKENLKWINCRQLEESELAGYRETVAEEEKAFQTMFSEKLTELLGE